MIDAILYVTHTGISWRSMPVDFPPWQTVYAFFQRLEKKGAVVAINEHLRRGLLSPRGARPNRQRK